MMVISLLVLTSKVIVMAPSSIYVHVNARNEDFSKRYLFI